MANIININMLIDIKQELNELIIEDVPSVFVGILEIYNGKKLVMYNYYENFSKMYGKNM